MSTDVFVINKDIKPFEGMKLRYIRARPGDYHYHKTATVHKNVNGLWFVEWEDGTNSGNGGCSGVVDEDIFTCWELAPYEVVNILSKTRTLKERNMASDATTCHSCHGKLSEPYPGLKHCPKCKP